MANENLKPIRVLLNNTTGTQDITIPGFGTPKAAIFYYNIDVADNTVKGTIRKSVGYTDGTRQAVSAIASDDGQSTTATKRMQRDDAVICEITGAGTLTAQVNFDQWIVDGVRVNITTASALQRLCTIVLINGDDVAGAHVESTGQLSTGINNINTVGFEPSLVFIDSVGLPDVNTFNDHSVLSSGIALNDGTDKNMSVMGFNQNAALTSNTGQYTSVTHVVGQYFNASIAWSGVINNYDSQGFDINITGATGGDRVVFLALKFTNNPLIELTQEDSPTSTGTKSFGSTASTPSFSMLMTGNNSLTATGQSNLGGGIFVADSSNQYGMSISSESGVTTTVEDEINKSGGLVQLLNGAKQFDSTFTGFTATGADFNFTTVDGTARKWISLFIGDAATSGFQAAWARSANILINMVN